MKQLVQGDLQVLVPESTLIQEQKILVEGRDDEIEFHPSVRKYYVELQPPTLTDPSPDLTRLVMGYPEEWWACCGKDLCAAGSNA